MEENGTWGIGTKRELKELHKENYIIADIKARRNVRTCQQNENKSNTYSNIKLKIG